METVNEALTLLKRQSQLEHAMKQPGGIRITDEQELHVLGRRLADFRDRSGGTACAHALRRPVTEVTAGEVEMWTSDRPLKQ
ncbi:MAG: hypothetical protein M3O26_03185 [Pseudomonadota bacterium]|nr:hypothetical protein [Pseudomonadota bacterium]